MNSLIKVQFNLLRRVCLNANLLVSSNVHHLVDSSHRSSDHHRQATTRKHHRELLLSELAFRRRALINVEQKRFKADKKSSGAADEESDSDTEDDEDTSSGSEEDEDDKVELKKIETINTRIDVMIKYTLGGSRAKADQAVNEGKVRINGEKVLKKSDTLLPGDVVEVIHGFVKNEDNKLRITRLEFEHIDDKKNSRGKYMSKVRVTKNLEIDNYEGDASHSEN